jgi:PAS domain-containing protein
VFEDERAVNNFLENILRDSKDAIVGYDLNGVIQCWSIAAERLFGYRHKQAEGHSLRLLQDQIGIHGSPIAFTWRSSLILLSTPSEPTERSAASSGLLKMLVCQLHPQTEN